MLKESKFDIILNLSLTLKSELLRAKTTKKNQMSSEQKFHEDSIFKFPHFCLTQIIVLLVMETITIILHYRISDKF